MRGVRSGCTVCLLTVAAASLALEPLPEAEFDALLEDVHEANRWNPAEVAALAGPAEEALAWSDSVLDRIRVMVALAPARALRKGYLPVRHELVKMIGAVPEAPDSSRALAELRFGISDLALRNGEIRFSMRQIVSGFKHRDANSPAELEARLYEQAARINLAAGYPFDALHLLDLLDQTQVAHSPQTRFSRQLLRAEALGDAHSFAEMSEILDELARAFNRHSNPPRIAVFWVLRTWEAIYRDQLDEASTYIQVAHSEAQICGCVQVIAEITVLEAFLEALSGKNPKEVSDKLALAGIIFNESGYPSRFPHLLMKTVQLAREMEESVSMRPFIEELAAFAHRENNLLAQSNGMAAWADLMRGMEPFNQDLFAEVSLDSLRYSEHFARTMGELQVRLQESLPDKPLLVQPERPASRIYYLFILLLILLVLVLVLAQRILSQRHVNAHMAQAVSQAKAAEAAAAESNRMKTQFLANVSHEIKTPMSGLIGMASLLDELITEPNQRKYIRTVRTCSENLLVLMNDLLDLSRMESGQFDIEERPVNPEELVDYALEVARGPAGKKNLQLIHRIEPEVPSRIICDGTRIGQILTNLLNNAIKFTERGMITVRLRFEQTMGTAGNLVLEVSDTGVGIPRDRLELIYEPFNKGMPDEKEDPSGTGLGLAICKKLTELMGGSIRAESEPGKGSCFTVRIPVTT